MTDTEKPPPAFTEARLAAFFDVDLFRFEGERIALKDAFRKERSAPLGA